MTLRVELQAALGQAGSRVLTPGVLKAPSALRVAAGSPGWVYFPEFPFCATVRLLEHLRASLFFSLSFN